jgi:hypothetical protein
VERSIKTVITAITGDRVIVGKEELVHAMQHFLLPEDIFLELLERVLKDPTDIFVDKLRSPREYHIFYRLNDGRYLSAIVKRTDQGSFFCSMYSTGKSIRAKHKKLKRLKL